MGKRSNFERRERDFYPTPESAVLPLLPHLETNTRFSEPCAGDGALIRHLEKHGHFKYWASDIEPQAEFIMRCDAMILTLPLQRSDCVITNPPWDRHVLHPMIEHFRKQTDTWLLFDADWWHTKQARPFKPYCAKVVSVGRVKWIEGSKSTGKDNCAWYLFVKEPVEFTKLY
jgi:hypothetical protein